MVSFFLSLLAVRRGGEQPKPTIVCGHQDLHPAVAIQVAQERRGQAHRLVEQVRVFLDSVIPGLAKGEGLLLAQADVHGA